MDLTLPDLDGLELTMKVREMWNVPIIMVTARSDDGLIMGLRHRIYDIEGVQFHPESILTNSGKQLLGNFIGRPAAVAAVLGY